MSYPEPIEGETAESLYKQAMFFYNQYEKAKERIDELERAIKERCRDHRLYGCGEYISCEDCPINPSSGGIGGEKGTDTATSRTAHASPSQSGAAPNPLEGRK